MQYRQPTSAQAGNHHSWRIPLAEAACGARGTTSPGDGDMPPLSRRDEVHAIVIGVMGQVPSPVESRLRMEHSLPDSLQPFLRSAPSIRR